MKHGVVRQLLAFLSTEEWCAIAAQEFGQEVIVAVQDDPTPVPDQLAGMVRYTRRELQQLVDRPADELRQTHLLKKVFDGVVV